MFALTTVRSPSMLLKIFCTAGSWITSALGSIKVTSSPCTFKSSIIGLQKGKKKNKINFSTLLVKYFFATKI